MRKQYLPILLLTYGVVGTVSKTGATETRPIVNDTTRLAGVEVSAMRVDDKLKSTAPAHNLDSRQMLTTGVTDIGDAIRRLPGINLRDYGGSGGMKTISVRGLGTQHTGILYDGVSLGDIQGGQIDLSRYSLDNLTSLTLNIGDSDDIFQPARVMAAASTLSVNTIKSPDMMSRHPAVTVKMKAGSFGMLSPSFNLGLSNGKNLGMTLNADYIHARNDYPFTLRNGQETTRERRTNSQINSWHAEWNGIWKPSASGTLRAKAYWYDNSRRLPGPVIYYNSDSHERLKERNAFGQLNYSTRISDKVSLRVLAKFNWGFTRYEDENAIYPGGKLDRRYTQREEYGSAGVMYVPTAGLSLTYTADFWHNSLTSNEGEDNRPWRNSFLQAIGAKWKVWRLTATARGLLSLIRDKSKSLAQGKDVTRFSPSVGVSVQPLAGREWHVRASYKNVMRMPTFNELYFEHYGTVNLDPEDADQLNLGTTVRLCPFAWLPSIELTADGFYNQVRNKIVAIPYNMFVWRMTNIGRVRILGADVTLNADFRLAEGHDLLLSGNYSYQRAASRTDRTSPEWMKQMPYTPLNSGAWSLTWQNPWVNIVIHGQGCSSRYSTTLNIPSTRIAGYMETGFTLYREFRIRKVNLEARADLINAFDKQYEIVARYPMPGRSFALSLKLTI